MPMKKIQLSDHFTYGKLMRFVLPTVLMMFVSSLYSIVDAFFVSNYAGKEAFAAVNLILPLPGIVASLGLMLGMGGCAVVSRTLGEGDQLRAQRYFSMFSYVGLILGTVTCAVGLCFIRQIAESLGAEGETLRMCVQYGTILSAVQPIYMMQLVMGNFYVAAEKPSMGLKVTLASGLINVVLDYLFIAVLDWGVSGAALATAIGQSVGGVVSLVFFGRRNSSLLRLVPAKIDWKVLYGTCLNGSSELLLNISASVVNIMYNFQLMRLSGSDGIAAYGAVMYANYYFSALIFGYSVGSAPVVGYHYGAKNETELKSLFKKSVILMSTVGVGLTALSVALAGPAVGLFTGYDDALFGLAAYGFKMYAPAFLAMGVNVWASGFFTALGNSGFSALISCLRTLIFQTGAVMLLPQILGMDGIWISAAVAELLTVIVVAILLRARKDYYRYA